MGKISNLLHHRKQQYLFGAYLVQNYLFWCGTDESPGGTTGFGVRVVRILVLVIISASGADPRKGHVNFGIRNRIAQRSTIP